MREFVSKRVSGVPPSGIRKFFDIASEMKDVISLSVGEPDFVTPWNIRESAILSMERGHTHYTSNHGMASLRRKITEYLDTFNTHYDIKNILVTVGASEALDLAFRAVIEPGDEVLIPAPSYVSYMPGVTFTGGTPVPVATCAENDFKLTAEAIDRAATEKTKAVVLPYPNNPTGAIMKKKDLEAIIPVILKHDLLVISDEIYGELTYGSKHVSIASFEEIYPRCIVINGFSKAFAMTGFRLGYAAGPNGIISQMLKIHQYSMLCASTISQYAGEEALSAELKNDFAQVKRMVRDYDRRRRYLLNELREMGLETFEPEGAFYIFPSIKSTGMTSEEFCYKLIEKKKVACVPGTAFGEAGEGYIRCSYASSTENLKESAKRIKEFLTECRK